MRRDFICPHCGMDFNHPTVDQIVDLLKEDKRRDIYEIGNCPGVYTISYSNGQKMPSFTREVALAVEGTGIVQRHPECDQWFARPKPNL